MVDINEIYLHVSSTYMLSINKSASSLLHTLVVNVAVSEWLVDCASQDLNKHNELHLTAREICNNN